MPEPANLIHKVWDAGDWEEWWCAGNMIADGHCVDARRLVECMGHKVITVYVPDKEES